MKEAYKVIDNFLSIEDLEMLSDYVDNNGSAQSRYKSKDIANNIYTKNVDKFKELGILGLSDEITISKNNKPIPKHKDNKVSEETHKILIYLNNVNNGGGTYFYIDGKELNPTDTIISLGLKNEYDDIFIDVIKKSSSLKTTVRKSSSPKTTIRKSSSPKTTIRKSSYPKTTVRKSSPKSTTKKMNKINKY